jgi:hypothetical protein
MLLTDLFKSKRTKSEEIEIDFTFFSIYGIHHQLGQNSRLIHLLY